MDALRLLSRSTNIRSRKNNETFTQHIPSEGPQKLNGTTVSSRKRKRDEDSPPVPTITSDQELESVDSIRKYQTEHKIRIVDFRRFREDDISSTRKIQKEAARSYPRPLLSFANLKREYGISEKLSANIAEQGYYEPTVVQTATLPLLLDVKSQEPDVLTIAPTGSGKTLAFLIPLIEKIDRVKKAGNSDRNHPSAIVLAPTKELVSQIVSEGIKLSRNTNVSVDYMSKRLKSRNDLHNPNDSSGSDLESNADEPLRQKNTNSRAPDILVSTPLSLVHLISKGSNPLFSHVRNLVLDEADVLLDPLFREQTMNIWSACANASLRVSLWSATIGASIEELACKTIDSRKPPQDTPAIQQPLWRVIIGLKDSSLPTISHRLVYAATEPGKLIGFRQLLHPSRPVPGKPSTKSSQSTSTEQTTPLRPPFLVFTQTIERATALHKELEFDIPATAGGSSRIAVLHSSLSDKKRADVMARFRKGQVWILITTDLLSRGVDFRGVNGVVNYDIPTTSAGYIHRAGRTGRAGREGGVCVTFYTKDDIKYVKAIANVIAASEKKTTTTTNKNPTRGNDADLVGGGLQRWILNALPDVSKKERKELKERGVESRRAIKLSDDAKEKNIKRKARIGTQSGYEKKLENNRRGAMEASQKKHFGGNGRDGHVGNDDVWGGLSD